MSFQSTVVEAEERGETRDPTEKLPLPHRRWRCTTGFTLYTDIPRWSLSVLGHSDDHKQI